ncbi:ATP-binding protein [Colwellia sp. BRX8-9]|uniref:ATP-binding protein n=1 Tax=Colwellia sp. BRX8-9 TaxID=2759831 RepID=UPI0015F4E732|nr:ATP-binding protein [Colwellia sp. BRX8-9]MBA6349917.1 ATP-binding protein [Colwellia sp. BRX8-9]
MTQHSIIPASLAITSMRDSGYKTAAHAIAELIDNSIQATADTVQLICIDKSSTSGQRRIKYVDQIAIFDNGKGMSPETLQQALQFGGGSNRDDPSGIGKFGMGLPSATISQCRRLEVYSWQSGKCFYTYLDLDEIETGKLKTVPGAVAKNIPAMWSEAIGEDYDSDKGTIIIWSDLDRVSWKTSKSLYIHSEKLIGRMYRHFINRKQVVVRFKSFVNDVVLKQDTNKLFQVNDPLFLYKKTILPELPGDYKNESFFEQVGEPHTITINLKDGTTGEVILKYSRVVKTIHQAIARNSSSSMGATPYGKLAEENNGISIVRSGRELKITKEIYTSLDTRDRWFGIEISFTPELDELFGVTFDKQDVVNFERINLDLEAENEGYDTNDKTQIQEFKDKFEKEKSNRYWIHHIIVQIDKNITELKKHTSTLAKDDSPQKSGEENKEKGLSHAEKIAKKVADERKNNQKQTDSEREFNNPNIPPEEKEGKLAIALEGDGIDKEEAESIAKILIKNDCNVKFIEQSLKGNAFFDIAREAGSIIVQLNNNHEFYKVFEQLDDDKKELIKLVLIAWAQCEDDSNASTRSEMEDIRSQWGKMMKNYLYELNN